MSLKNSNIQEKQPILENITKTILYEGYSLYPYHRSAVKNQKPIPFGVVYPEHYNNYNEHANSLIQTECIVTGKSDLKINIKVRFLNLKTVTLLKKDKKGFTPLNNLMVKNQSYQAGWQTIERIIDTDELSLTDLINGKTLPVNFDNSEDKKTLYNEKSRIEGKEIHKVSGIKGTVVIKAFPVLPKKNAYRIKVGIKNNTVVENAEKITRDEVLPKSFLSTNSVLNAVNGQFISDQNPQKKWVDEVAQCQNINTWPILIDRDNTTMLSSPIILYDYPQINTQSTGDLFDSTEIEEALLLHVNLLSDEEKKKIGQSDEKLQNMLNRVSEVTPREMMNFHSSLKENIKIKKL